MIGHLLYCWFLCHTDAPRVTIELLNSSPDMVNVGTKLVLHCIAEGFPVPTIQWYKNDILIPQESSKLYLASTDVPGSTLYSCKGKNNAGNIVNTASANITVTVESMYMYI